MRFFCHCLNVNIDVWDANDNQETLTKFIPVDLAQLVNISHEWLVCDVVSEQSVHITWHSLIHSIPVREMKLNRCLSCHLYTHVTNVAPNRILINKDLFDENTVKHVYDDMNYSKLAKIILPTMTNMTRVLAPQDENIQRDCELAQQIYRQSIDEIERDTEEKIRMYQREQEQLLENKTENLNKELDTFLQLMRTVSRQTSSTKASPTLQTYINENSTESGFGSDIFDVNSVDFGRNSSTIERAFSERPMNLDEETNDDPMLDNRNWSIDNDNVSNFATSLPRNIGIRPSTGYTIHRQVETENVDLERIGKSFRDLSHSLCTDGTELFGELPSPRYNNQAT